MARRVPIYLALDIAVVLALYLVSPVTRSAILGIEWWYWPITYVPFALLTIFERSDAPLVFNKELDAGLLIGYSLLLWIVLLGLHSLLDHTLPPAYPSCFPPQESNYFAIVLNGIHAGLSEEPQKACLINCVALIFQRPCHLRIRNHSLIYRVDENGKRDILWAGGIISVAIWAFIHVPLACYDLKNLTIAFCMGIGMFFVLMRTRDLRPLILAHILLDIL